LGNPKPRARFQVEGRDASHGPVAGSPPPKRRHCNEIAQDKRKSRLRAHG
jgi:hypothetical protein